ncbi:MAG: AI-2E family transporter [Desulfuromonadales bacterium]
MANSGQSNNFNRVQMLLLFLALTAAIATGLAIFSSVSKMFVLIQEATAGLFLPLLLSLVATFLLNPIIDVIEREKIGRSTCIFIIYSLLALVFIAVFSWLLPHGQGMWQSLQEDLPRYTARLIELSKSVQGYLHEHLPFLDNYNLSARVRTMAELLVADILVATPKSALRIGSIFLLLPLFTFFFLRDGEQILRRCIALAPNRHFEMVHDLVSLIGRQTAHFIRGRIIEAFIVGVVVAIGLSFTDIRYTLLLGVFAGVTNLVPYIGPIIGMIPGLLIALVDLGLGPQFWWILIVYFPIAQVIVDNFILIPILISRVSNLHPLLVIVAIVMGGKLYGVLGMIIAVPVVSAIKIAIIEIHHYRRTFTLPDVIEPDRPA